MSFVDTFIDIANLLMNEDLIMDYFEALTLQHLSFIYKKRIDGFAIGDEGDDSTTGGEENEMLIGRAGDDVLNGGLGSDVLTGGRGFEHVCFHRL